MDNVAAYWNLFSYSIVTAVIASFAFGVVGTYVIVRRISYIAGAIAHCAFGGIGIALYLKSTSGLTWCDPIYGAIVSALLAALLIGCVSMYAKEREDTVIGAIWSIGMAIGIIFIFKTPGYQADLKGYLFGDILLISQRDLWLIAGLDLLILSVVAVFYNKFLAICFDPEFSLLRGVKPGLYYLLLLCLIALSVVILVPIVGIIMVIAFLTLPAAIATRFASRLWQVMLIAVTLSLFFTLLGFGVSIPMNLPTGPVVIVIAGLSYFLAAVGKYILKRGK